MKPAVRIVSMSGRYWVVDLEMSVKIGRGTFKDIFLAFDWRD
jgi:hypothetical protein